MSTEITVVNDIVEINVTEEVIVIEAPSGAYPLPTGVYSVYGRTGNVVAMDGDYNLTQLGDVTITNATTGQVLRYNGTAWVNSTESYVGTVTSVDMSVPTGFTIGGNPITTSGTLALGMASGYSIPTTANQATWTTAYNDSIVSAAVTGSTTKTLTLTQQDGGTVTASWSDLQPVTSVFGRTGDVVAQSGDYNTLQVTENTNLYFTDQRARFAISGDATSGVVYSNTTGIIALDDIPNTSLLHDSVTVNGSTVALGGSTSFTTTAVAEGSNLYYTQARFNTAFAAKSTTDLAEGTNLYFTTARAQAAISGTSPISVTSGNVSISQANGSTDGYLSSSDWTAFNAKQAALTFSSPLVNTSGTISIPAATSSVNGYLTSTDWTTFNGKQAALSGNGFVKISGTTISYDNSTYLTTIEGITAGGELSGTYASPSLVNSAVTGKVLTGLNITGGTVSATDSILAAFGKVQNQINGLIGGSIYQGTWNASTNTPALASGVGTKGYYYIVSVAGSTNLDGITDWNIGDWAIYDGTAWQQVDNTDAVVSVNGFTGAVSLTTSNISEGTNLYYTDARARGSVSAGTGISYNSTSGVITNSAPDQTVSLTGAGTTSISGAYPNFTITSNDQYTGTVTSVGITESAAALSITGSPVTTSGNINIGFAGASTDYVAGDGSLVPFPTVVTQAQNLVTEVYNNTGATLTKGTVVYINGGQGNLPTVTKAQANSDATSAQTYGVVRTDITNMNNGYITVIGNLDNIDTQAYAAGTQLYLSGTTAGAWTDVKPYAPIHLVYVGIVVRSHPTQGVVEIRIQNGYEMDELHNVSAQNPNNGDILQYVSSTSLWTKTAGTTSAIAEGSNLYYTDARARGAISLTTTGNNGASTYNSTTGVLNVPTYTLAGLGGINLTSLSATSPLLYDNTTGVFSIQQSSGSQAGYLSAADWTTFNNKQAALTNPVTGTGTTNYLPKFTGASTIGDSLIYSNTGVAIGGTTITDSNLLNVIGDSASVNIGLVLNNTNSTNAKIYGIQNVSKNLVFYDYSSSAPRLTINNTGNVGIGTSTPAELLEVFGKGRFSIYGTAGINETLKLVSNANYNAGRGVKMGFYVPAGTNSEQLGAEIGAVTSASTSSDLFFNTTNAGVSTERMRITSGGYVGINSTSPISQLSVKGVGGSTGVTLTLENGGGITGLNNPLGIIDFYSNDPSVSSNGVFGRISVNNEFNGSWDGTPGRVNTYMAFSTTSSTTLSERMRITSGGNIGIGNTGLSGQRVRIYGETNDSTSYAFVLCSANGTDLFNVRNDGLMSSGGSLGPFNFNPGGRVMYVNSSGQIGSNPSTRESKININPISDVSYIYDLNPVSFYFRKTNMETYEYTDEYYDEIRYGFIADEVEPLNPDLVSYNVNEDGSKKMAGVEYISMIPVLVKALQEQKKLIEELSAKVTALENK